MEARTRSSALVPENPHEDLDPHRREVELIEVVKRGAKPGAMQGTVRVQRLKPRNRTVEEAPPVRKTCWHELGQCCIKQAELFHHERGHAGATGPWHGQFTGTALLGKQL